MPADKRSENPKELARAALRELDAEYPDATPAQLMGGPLAWGDSAVAMEAERDPSNAPVMRPHVIAPCQKLQSEPALRLHCTCGKGLDYLALASLATGVLVVSSPTLLPPKRRTGGPGDLGPIGNVDDPEAGWALLPWEASMRDKVAAHHTGWNGEVPHLALGDNAVIMGDTAKRQTFHCVSCGATHTFKNIQLLRLVLKSIASGQRKVRLAQITEGR